MTSDETLSSLRESNCATGTLSTALSCPKEPPERQSLQLRCTLDAIQRDPQTRDAKWARGSRSQTHRRAAKGDFTQDDGKVERRLVPDRRPSVPIPFAVLKAVTVRGS